MSQQNPLEPTHLNRTSLYNPQISPPFVNILNANEKTPSLNFSNAFETKLTPMGHSPKNVEASRVEVQEKNAEVTLRAY
jgi:hypothetical protein